MNFYQQRNIELTRHAQERITERIGSKKRALQLLRSAEKMWEINDRAFFRNKGFEFVCRLLPKCTVLITLYPYESTIAN